MFGWLKKSTSSQFRIRVEELNSGVKRYYPQVYEGVASGWQTIISVNGIHVTTSAEPWHCETELEASVLVDQYKAKLLKQAENGLKLETIIKI